MYSNSFTQFLQLEEIPRICDQFPNLFIIQFLCEYNTDVSEIYKNS